MRFYLPNAKILHETLPQRDLAAAVTVRIDMTPISPPDQRKVYLPYFQDRERTTIYTLIGSGSRR